MTAREPFLPNINSDISRGRHPRGKYTKKKFRKRKNRVKRLGCCCVRHDVLECSGERTHCCKCKLFILFYFSTDIPSFYFHSTDCYQIMPLGVMGNNVKIVSCSRAHDHSLTYPSTRQPTAQAAAFYQINLFRVLLCRTRASKVKPCFVSLPFCPTLLASFGWHPSSAPCVLPGPEPFKSRTKAKQFYHLHNFGIQFSECGRSLPERRR